MYKRDGDKSSRLFLSSHPQRPCRIVEGLVVVVGSDPERITLAKETALCHMQAHEVGLALGR